MLDAVSACVALIAFLVQAEVRSRDSVALVPQVRWSWPLLTSRQ